jgi:hypothetical protein
MASAWAMTAKRRQPSGKQDIFRHFFWGFLPGKTPGFWLSTNA